MANDYPAGSPSPAPPPLDDDVLAELRAAGLEVDVSTAARAAHGRDWWPLSLRDVQRGRVPQWPGAVVRARSVEDVVSTLDAARRHVIPVTAQGGRSGVLGGAVAPAGGIALDLTGLNRVVSIDPVSATVDVQAGVFGPDLEATLRHEGFTLGHFPQSFELSTVGGWLACRGAGQYSNRYGKIEDMVRALTVVLAGGDVVELGGRGPRQAVGPDLVQLFVGSEGALGVITGATLVLHPRPAFEQRAAYAFASFGDGLTACRKILQRGARPAVLRLYDETESQRSFGLDACALIVLDEGDEHLVDATLRVVAEECAGAGALSVDLVGSWLEHRNDVSALVPWWERGYVVDTIEVAGHWGALEAMSDAVLRALRALPDTLVASVHQSHAYLDGACLYFTFAGNPTHDLLGYYRGAWDVATRTVLALGGSLSHHHGVGRNRARFAPEALASAYPLLESVKALLDPHGIMNPGVLGLGAPPW
jgi:alkyldihydroxyacetonephosphate synthase